MRCIYEAISVNCENTHFVVDLEQQIFQITSFYLLQMLIYCSAKSYYSNTVIQYMQ